MEANNGPVEVEVPAANKVDTDNEFGAGDTTDHASSQPHQNVEQQPLSKVILEENNNIPLGYGLMDDDVEGKNHMEVKPGDSDSSRERIFPGDQESNINVVAPSSSSLNQVLSKTIVTPNGSRGEAMDSINKSGGGGGGYGADSLSKFSLKAFAGSGRNSFQGLGSNSSVYNGPAPEGETEVNNCSVEKEGHICLDCFPIPDELLTQLHRQTGMTKLMCLQTVQTVIKFYKQDLKCAKFFAPNLTSNSHLHVDPVLKDVKGETFSECSADSSSFNESILLFKNMSLVPPQKESVIERADDVDDEVLGVPLPTVPVTEGAASYFPRVGKASTPRPMMASKPMKQKQMSGTEQFGKLIERLRVDSTEFWSDPQNASFVFTFFRKLNKLVVKLDRSVLKRFLLENEMDFVWILTTFLRRERRWSIKWEIIGVLGTIAARDSRARRKLLESDFSAYLARAIVQFDSDPARLAAYAELLTVLFTGGKPVPIHLLESFDDNFVVSVLNMIEDDDSRPGWALPETFIKLLLAYNLQFSIDDVYDNLTIVGITRVRECKTLTSCLVDWMETKDRPLTSSWEVSVSLHQCVIKLATDIYSCRTTSYVFSNTQSLVLLRQLITSLPTFLPGDKRRTSYLKLIEAILRHTKYHYVHNTPSLESLTDILMETSSLSFRDQDVVRSIFKQFPQLRRDSSEDVF